MHTHQLVKNRRLDIRQHDAVQKFKNTALDQRPPVQPGLMVLFLKPGQHIQNHHFMRLLVQLRKAVRADMIVPTLDVRRLI